jgi:hypothetical protein
MKPKPLESLNHFTVPVAITSYLYKLAATNPGATKPGTKNQEWEMEPLRALLGAAMKGRQILCLKSILRRGS